MNSLIRALLLYGFLVSTAWGAGSSLTASVAKAPATVDLSGIGTTDWVHWGQSGVYGTNRKEGVSTQISSFKAVGRTLRRYKPRPGRRVAYQWNNGTPTASATTNYGVYLGGFGDHFELSVLADTRPMTLTLYLGGQKAGGRLRASLSDGSAPAVTVNLKNSTGMFDRAVTFNFAAASTGQKLQLSYTLEDDYGDGSKISLAGAALRGTAGNQPPSLAPIGKKTTSAGQLLSFTVTANDVGGPLPLVLDAGTLPAGANFTDNGNGTGLFYWTPTQSNVKASPYSLTFTATDGNGFGLSTSETIQISVTTATGIDPVSATGVVPVTHARYLSEDFENAGWAKRYKVLKNVTRERGVAARTGSFGMRIRVPKGRHWGGRILFDHSRHGQGGNFDEIWTRYYVRFGPNWRRNDWRMGKVGFRARGDEICGAPCLEMTDSHKLTDSGSIAGISYYHQRVSAADLKNKKSAYGHKFWTGAGEREREQWYCMETHHVLNTPGKNNGIYQNWIDGTLVSDHRGIRHRDSATFDIDDSVLIAFIGGRWRADRDMSVYFDDWAVSDERIGCQ